MSKTWETMTHLERISFLLFRDDKRIQLEKMEATLILTMPLQEIGFLVTVGNRHQILYISDQNLLSRSYETVTEHHNTRRS